MAVRDQNAKEGVKLVIADYPYAADGLELWGALKAWNADYVEIYYKDDRAVQRDAELQSWWTEFRTVAHADKKDAPGWPELKSKESLVQIVTIMQWLASVQHAAVNFSQFHYGGFMPQRPTVTRRLIPDEGTAEWEELQADPEKFYLSTISDPATAFNVTSTFEFTSSHATKEEYISDRAPNWTQNEEVEPNT
jgi:lipoxygenase